MDIYHLSFLLRKISDWGNLCIDSIDKLDLVQFKARIIKYNSNH